LLGARAGLLLLLLKKGREEKLEKLSGESG
jgi:hypothetical protein